MRRWALVLALSCACQATPAQQQAPAPVTILELDGTPHDPVTDERADLLLFVRTDCPISNRYAPELARIAASIASEPVDVWLVYVDADETPERIREHMAEYALPGTPLRDVEQQLARRVGVKVTPEAALFDAQGARLYRGRIDDWYVDYGKNRQQASTHELRDALAALRAGTRPAVGEAEAVGCPLPPL